MYSQGSQFRPNLHQGAASMHPPSQQGGGGGAPPPPPPPGPPPLQPPQFPPAPAPHLYHHGQPGPPRPLPGLAPPPWVTQSPSLQGQMSYGTPAARFPPPQHGQLLPPPLPGFVSSFVHSSYENPFETVPRPPSMLPPPPPPPPPRDTTEDGNGYVKEDTGKDKGNLEVKGILPPPPRKPAEQEVVKKIEVLCHYIAKNGPAFEEVARAKQSGNPEFAFLIGGEPGSEAAIAHEYFQWMKSKCCMDLARSDKTTSLPAPLEIEDASKSAQDPAPLEIEVASNSAQDSDMDMDMEDDMNESDRDQGVSDSVEGLKLPVSKSNEVSFVKEQSPEHPHLISGSEASGLAVDGRDDMNQSDKDQGVSDSVEGLNVPVSKSNEVSLVKEQSPEHPHLISGSEASGLAVDGREHHIWVHEKPSAEDYSAAAGDLRYTYQKRKRVIPLTENLSLDSVSHAAACVSGEEASGTHIKSRSPLYKRLQRYASDDFTEDDDGMPFEDVSPVRVSPSITPCKTNSHEDEMTILYADVGCENISTKEEVFLPSVESGSTHSIDLLSGKPNVSQESREVLEKSDMAYVSLDTSVELQNNNNGDQTSFSLVHKDNIQRDVDFGGDGDKVQKINMEKCLTSKKIDQYGRLVRKDASESDSDGARYSRRRARRGRSRSRSRSRSWSRSRSRSPHSRRRRKSRSPRRRRDKRNRSRSWTPKRQRSRSRSPHSRHKVENVSEKRQDIRGQIPDCMDFLRGRCYRGVSCKYLHHTSTSGDAVKQYTGRNQQYLEPPQDPKNCDINGVSQVEMNTDMGGKNPLSQVSVEHGTSIKEEFKNSEVLPYSSGEMGKDCCLSVNTNSYFVNDDVRRVTSSGTVPSPAGVNLSDSKAAINGVKVEQAQQEEFGVQLMDNGICRQLSEALPSEVLPVQLKVVSEAQHLTGVVSQNERSAFPDTIQPPQSNIPSSQGSLVDAPVFPTQPISQPFFGGSSCPYPIPTSMSQTQVHQVTPASSFPPQSVLPQPGPPNFSSSGFHSYASQLPCPPSLPQDVNAAYMSMPPTANIHGQVAPMEKLPLYQAQFQDQHSQSAVPPQPTWTPLPPAPNSAFPNPAFHLQYLQHPMQPGNEFFRPMMRPYSHEVPYNNNVSQLSVSGASKLHYNPYASTFEQTPGNSRFNSVLRQDTEPNYKNNNDALGSSASASGHGIAYDSKLNDLPFDSTRSGGQVPGNENLPLFESVESSSTPFGKLGYNGKRDCKSDVIKKSSSRQAIEGTNAANMSPGDGEFGDTAIDAEVGAVENGSPHLAEEGNWSPENPAYAGNTASGDNEIGQVERSGKSRSGKDSRSMKHFRVALADFVKEVLKPSWRQGNMSKEAFKTIVKKTVDKVSGAMKKHQIPKSQAKINQYVESSQRKLTKLVMGYVDKYVKV